MIFQHARFDGQNMRIIVPQQIFDRLHVFESECCVPYLCQTNQIPYLHVLTGSPQLVSGLVHLSHNWTTLTYPNLPYSCQQTHFQALGWASRKYSKINWLVVEPPLWKIWVRQWEGLSIHIMGNKIHVWNLTIQNRSLFPISSYHIPMFLVDSS